MLAIAITVTDFIELMRRASGKNIPVHIIFQMSVCKMPHYLSNITPFIALLSSLFAFSRLTSKNELLIIKLSGVSTLQLVGYLIFVYGFISFATILLSSSFVASCMQRYKNLDIVYFQRTSFSIADSGFWIHEYNNKKHTIIRANRLDEKQIFYDITFHHFDTKNNYLHRYDCKKGYLSNGKWMLESIRLTSHDLSIKHFQKLEVETSLTFKKIEEGNNPIHSISVWKIPRHISIVKKAGLSTLNYVIYLHRKIATVALSIVMAILSFAVGQTYIRGHSILRFGMFSSTIGIFTHLLGDITYALGIAKKLPPGVSAWSPVLFLFLLTIAAVIHFEEAH